MTKFCITYKVAGSEDRREIVISPASGNATARTVARAIIEQEIEGVDSPFGLDEVLTAEQALKKFGISDVRFSVASDEATCNEASDAKPLPRD